MIETCMTDGVEIHMIYHFQTSEDQMCTGKLKPHLDYQRTLSAYLFTVILPLKSSARQFVNMIGWDKNSYLSF